MNRFDIALLWILSTFASLTIVAGKLALQLFVLATDPPADPATAAAWARRRRWLAYSEMAALPAFGTIGVTSTIYFSLPPAASVGISMALGGLGFGLLLDGLQFIYRKKLGLQK